MARQCHLDTCPTGIATQREDLRAKFTGTPEQVARFATAIAEDVREELAALGARSIGEIVGLSARVLRAGPEATLDLAPIVGARMDRVRRAPGAPAERHAPRHAPRLARRGRLVAALLRGDGPPPDGPIEITTADRSFGARIAGEVARGALEAPLDLEFAGSAGQSFGAFLPAGVTIRLTGQANDYVGKGLSGGTIVVRPEPDLATPGGGALVGNTCLYGATAGRLHVVGRAGMRFAVRNSGAEAVVDGVGAHGCEYMSGGVVAVLGSVGANFGAGMTGGRVYLVDPHGRHREQLHAASVGAVRLSEAIRERDDGVELVGQFRALVEAHRAAGSSRAAALLATEAMPLERHLARGAARGVRCGGGGAGGVVTRHARRSWYAWRSGGLRGLTPGRSPGAVDRATSPGLEPRERDPEGVGAVLGVGARDRGRIAIDEAVPQALGFGREMWLADQPAERVDGQDGRDEVPGGVHVSVVDEARRADRRGCGRHLVVLRAVGGVGETMRPGDAGHPDPKVRLTGPQGVRGASHPVG